MNTLGTEPDDAHILISVNFVNSEDPIFFSHNTMIQSLIFYKSFPQFAQSHPDSLTSLSLFSSFPQSQARPLRQRRVGPERGLGGPEAARGAGAGGRAAAGEEVAR